MPSLVSSDSLEVQPLPSVAVIVPVFNGSRTLVDCIESLLSQTIPLAEIIAVDDCSADDSVALLKRTFPQITLIRLPRNSGVGYARNVGVAAACSDLIAFLDQDDLWLPTRCERLAGHFVNYPGSDAVVTGVHVFAEIDDRDVLKSHRFASWIEHWVPRGGARALATELDLSEPTTSVTELPLAHLLNWTVAVTTSYAIRRLSYLAVGGCATWLRSADDWILLQNLARYGRVVQIGDRSVLYRVHDTNTSIATDWGVPLLTAAAAVRLGRALVSREQSRDPSTVGRLSDSGFLTDLLLGVARSSGKRSATDLVALVALLGTDSTDIRLLGWRLLRTRVSTRARQIRGRLRAETKSKL